MEAVEDDIVIETWVAVLVRMLGIPTCFLIDYIFTILYEVDGLAVSHSVLVDEVGCGMMDNVVMSHKTSYLRTKDLGTVPVSRVCAGINTAEDGFRRAWHIPILLHRVEDLRETRLCILIFLMIVEVRIAELSQFVFHLSLVNQVKRLTESLSSLLTVFHVIIIGLTVGAGT